MSPRARLVALLAGVVFIGIVLFALVSVIQATRNNEDRLNVRRVWSEEHQHWSYE